MPRKHTVTDKQLAANRANAKKSTGPSTPEGKAAVRYNALKHGILARAVIPEPLAAYDSQDDFDGLLRDLAETFAPTDRVQEMLVQQVAITYWRLARLYRVEGAEIARRRDSTQSDLENRDRIAWLFAKGKAPAAVEALRDRDALNRVIDDPAELRAYMLPLYPDLEDAGDSAILEAAESRAEQLQDAVDEAYARRKSVEDAARSLPDLDTVLKYCRYEARLQIQLHRTLNTLSRLQRLSNPDVSAPPS